MWCWIVWSGQGHSMVVRSLFLWLVLGQSGTPLFFWRQGISFFFDLSQSVPVLFRRSVPRGFVRNYFWQACVATDEKLCFSWRQHDLKSMAPWLASGFVWREVWLLKTVGSLRVCLTSFHPVKHETVINLGEPFSATRHLHHRETEKHEIKVKSRKEKVMLQIAKFSLCVKKATKLTKFRIASRSQKRILMSLHWQKNSWQWWRARIMGVFISILHHRRV